MSMTDPQFKTSHPKLKLPISIKNDRLFSQLLRISNRIIGNNYQPFLVSFPSALPPELRPLTVKSPSMRCLSTGSLRNSPSSPSLFSYYAHSTFRPFPSNTQIHSILFHSSAWYHKLQYFSKAVSFHLEYIFTHTCFTLTH